MLCEDGDVYDCRVDNARAEGIAAAITAVKDGDLIVLPTDTVYGVGADAFSPNAVAKLLAAKQRERTMPVPVLVGSRETLDGLMTAVPPLVRRLVDAFWPGALTLVVSHAPSLRWDLGETAGTVAVRMPDHPVALEVLRATGPLAVSSANVSGNPPAETAAVAQQQLGEAVRVYLEAGPVAEPVPSTIIDVSQETPQVLRAGAIDLAQLRMVAPALEDTAG